jgi:poly-gamma-glutamate synthesis protein (capsule biosynthesis protein)
VDPALVAPDSPAAGQPSAIPATSTPPSPAVTTLPSPTATIAPTLTPTSTPAITTLLFTGVIVPARCVQAKIDELGNPDYPYEEVTSIIQGADLAIGTFNATMSDIPPRTGCLSTYVLVGDPDNGDALKRAGFDLMGVATNHIKDCGLATCGNQAFFDTLGNLQRVDIPFFGAGENESAALQPVVQTINGVRFAFVSAGDSRQGEWTFATAGSPGIARLTSENIRTAIANAREVADVVIFMPHWGSEDIAVPNWVQRNQAQVIVKAGPDLVVGNHTHVIQAIQELSGIPVFYGLGNFVFDQDLEDHQQAAILLVQFKGREYQGYELIPTRFNEYGRVSVAAPQPAAELLLRVEQASSALGNPITPAYRPSMTVEEAAGLSPEEITRLLFQQYLDSYHILAQPDARRIVEDEIHQLTIEPAQQIYTAEFDADHIAGILFSVHPIVPQSDWMAGNGELAADGWVRNKSLFAGLKEEFGRYWLEILGTGL